jgi:hypothetical protein
MAADGTIRYSTPSALAVIGAADHNPAASTTVKIDRKNPRIYPTSRRSPVPAGR